MPIRRRALVQAVAASLSLPALARAQQGNGDQATPAQTAAWETPRTLGNPKAPTQVVEFFSLTCTHCAAFAQETFPKVEKNLINTGKIHWIFRDFPLDRVAVDAVLVGRALPPDRYVPFLLAMFASQDRWAFAQGVDPKEEIEKMALLAGMNRATFDAAWNDTALRDWILQEQAVAQKKYDIDATPTFLINGTKHSGQMSYDEFVKLIPNA
jgi:protein-disulfide isomerase